MPSSAPGEADPLLCHCAAVRHAARQVTQLYDQHLAPLGLRVTQFAILARVGRRGAVSVNALAAEMGMDRTTLSRNLRPLERQGWLAIGVDPQDRRGRALSLTPGGAALVGRARERWAEAQARFERELGPERARALREMLNEVASVAGPFGAG